MRATLELHLDCISHENIIVEKIHDLGVDYTNIAVYEGRKKDYYKFRIYDHLKMHTNDLLCIGTQTGKPFKFSITKKYIHNT